MLKQSLFHGYSSINVNMKSLNEKINTKAVFNKRDYRTAILVFNFSMDDEVLDITECKVVANFLRNDGNEVMLEAQILDAENGFVAVELDKQALACVGQNSVKLIIQYNDQQLYSPQMIYFVSDEVISEEGLITNFANIEKEKKRSREEYLRKYGVDIHVDKPEDGVKDTEAIFVSGEQNSSLLKINLFFNDAPMDITGYTISANVKEEMGDVITIPSAIQNETQGIVNISLPTNVVDEQGTNTFELSLQKGNKVIVTHKYSYTVLESLGSGDIGGENQLTMLQSLIQQVQQSKNIVNTITRELEVTQDDIDDIIGMVGGI